MNRTLEEQFEDAAALAKRQFPEDLGKRHEYHVEKLKEIAYGCAFRQKAFVAYVVGDVDWSRE